MLIPMNATLVQELTAGVRSRRGSPSRWVLARILLALVASGLPILAISLHVFGLVSEHTSAVAAVIPLAVITAAVVAFAPHRSDSIIRRGLAAGMVACAVYDGVRLFAVHVLGLMGDFIPRMGTWVTGDPDVRTGAVVGYIWRYVGDGGGLGIAFFVVAFAVGVDRWAHRPHRVVLAAVGYAVFPVWAGLIATVALAPHGQELMFPLNATTLTITLIGHLVFGFVLGLGFLKSQRLRLDWPWPPPVRRKPRYAPRVQPRPSAVVPALIDPTLAG